MSVVPVSKAGVGREFRGAGVLGHVVGVDEEFGGQDLARAGQALHDRRQRVVGEVFGASMAGSVVVIDRGRAGWLP